MILILTLDNCNGLLFNNRRLSRDQAVCDHILGICGDHKLWMNRDSASIFPESASNIHISEKFLRKAEKGDYCFAESAELLEYLEIAEMVIIYRWNRSYPSDVKVPQDALTGKTLVSSNMFSGRSHPEITQEVYQ